MLYQLAAYSASTCGMCAGADMQFAGGSLPPRGKLSGLRQCRKFTDNIRMNASAEQRKNLPMANFIFAGGKIYICRWQNLHLPFIRREFCRRPARHLQSANVSFADGKLKICNRQVRRWPSAKFMSEILPSANVNFLNGKYFAIGKLLKPACKRKPQQQACCKHSGYAILHKNEEPQLVWNCGFCIIFWR